MTRLLRFVGMLNAALWLGAAVFCSTALLVALNSQDALALLGRRYFRQVSTGIVQLIFTRLYYLQVICALVAWAHWLFEWLYQGRIPRRFWVGLLTGLFLLSLIGSLWLSPKLTTLHHRQYLPNQTTEQQAAAERQFRFWDGIFQVANLLMISGVTAYFWRVTHPPDELRPISSFKFRS